jgi:hypothetical protein
MNGHSGEWLGVGHFAEPSLFLAVPIIKQYTKNKLTLIDDLSYGKKEVVRVTQKAI